MAKDQTIQCTCGKFAGTARSLSPAEVNHAVCYCDDCQSFAHFLGRADDVLDEHGGTEVYQVSPARVAIDQGIDHLACVRLRPKGLYRWYSACCNTPIANTVSGKIPFVGLIHTFMVKQPDYAKAVGPIRCAFFPDSATGTLPASKRGKQSSNHSAD